MSGRGGGGRSVQFVQGRGGGRPRYADRGGAHMDQYHSHGGGHDNRFLSRNLNNKSRAIQRKHRPNPALKINEDVSMDDPVNRHRPQPSRFAPGAQRGGRGPRGKKWNQASRPGGGNNQHQHNFGPGWHKVTIINGAQYERDFLLNAIGQLSKTAFGPVSYANLGVNSVFFLEDRKSAESVAECSGKFNGLNDHPIFLRVASFGTPPTATIDAACEERIKTALATRYNPSLPGFNFQNFHNSPEVVLDYYLPLYRPSVVAKILTLIQESLPTLTYLDLSNNKLTALDSWQKLPQLTPALKGLSLSDNRLREIYTLERLKGMQLTEISLERNPLCDKFDDKDSYIRAVRKYFPKVTKLDGVEVAPVISFDIESEEIIIPSVLPGFFCNEDAKKVVMTFVEQYFKLYDSDNRQPLLDAYHDNAVMTLQSCYIKQGNIAADNSLNKLSAYIAECRNLTRNADANRLKRAFHHGKLDIVAFLARLPKTTHDIGAFYIDMSIALPTLIHFSVSGVFKERGSERESSIRAFQRSFNLIPFNNGFVIVNEMLFVTNATPEQAKDAFKTPVQAPTPSPSPDLTNANIPGPSVVLTLEQQVAMTNQFSLQSTMNEAWSRKCLEQNGWDYQKSALVFTDLHKRGQVPPEAFVK